jgi:hypothetical protein
MRAAQLFLFPSWPTKVRSNGMSIIALVMMTCISVLSVVGCTPAQKQTVLQIVTAINSHVPEVVAAAATVSATLAALTPADAMVIGVAIGAFDVLASSIQALTAAYIANPNATTLQQIQTAINTLEAQASTASLNALGIKDTVTIAALKALLTAATIVFGLIAQTESVAMLDALRSTGIVHLALLRRKGLLDEPVLAASVSKDYKTPWWLSNRAAVDYGIDQATEQGF